MPFDWTAIEQEAQEKINQAQALDALEGLRIKYLGRQGLLAKATGSISTLTPQERPEFGKKVNILKNNLIRLLEEKTRYLKEQKAGSGVALPIGRQTTAPWLVKGIDWTLPGAIPQSGSLHPITQTIQELSAIFSKMGFVIVEGPEIETEYNNFTGLNIPLEHPSRDAFDTFYLKPETSPPRQSEAGRGNQKPETRKERLLLRSHTSPVQIRVMKKYKPPLAVIVPGKVYRPDAVDASHSFMFHQLEGFLVDEDVTFSDLKGTLAVFVKKLFGEDTKMRFRPHFFPFTEPSAEVDISCIICRGNQKPETSPPRQSEAGRGNQKKHCSVCGGKGWLEVLGCGMIHPNVFANAGYPRGKYAGFAFGMGVDRIAMLKYGINDIRLFYENDLRFLRQF